MTAHWSRKIFYTLFISCISLLSLIQLRGQVDFSATYRQANPVRPNDTLSVEQTIEIHQEFLAKARQKKDSLSQIFGYIYLIKDYMRHQEFVKATQLLIEAEQFATASGNFLWQGRITHRKALVQFYTDHHQEAIDLFRQSLHQGALGRDSQNIAYNLEQIGSAFGYLENYDSAYHYYNKAFPLVEQYCGFKSAGVTYSNFGNLLSFDGRSQEAISAYEKALAFSRKAKDKNLELAIMSNLASEYVLVDETDKAYPLYMECIKANAENQWWENLKQNYLGLSNLYQARGEWEEALVYFEKHHLLQDSIIGLEVQKKIADLETKNQIQKKKLELQESKAKLAYTQRKLERYFWASFVVISFVLIGIWRWYAQAKATKLKLVQSREDLRKLTQLLIQKNTALKELEEQIATPNPPQDIPGEAQNFDENLYDQRILTEEDWEEFKVYFERSFPNYISRLRSRHINLTEAEERLFLFLKLNLSKKEVASILGISAESVKKTRYRLRKRLELDAQVQLSEYVRNF